MEGALSRKIVLYARLYERRDWERGVLYERRAKDKCKQKCNIVFANIGPLMLQGVAIALIFVSVAFAIGNVVAYTAAVHLSYLAYSAAVSYAESGGISCSHNSSYTIGNFITLSGENYCGMHDQLLFLLRDQLWGYFPHMFFSVIVISVTGVFLCTIVEIAKGARNNVREIQQVFY